MNNFLPVASPDITDLEERYVVEALRSSWISSSGKYLDRFEAEFAQLCEAPTALGVSNGTVALHLALALFDVGPGDEVILPSLTYIATANAARYVGATPVFVDVSPDTWCIDPQLVEAAITPRTKAIIAVHLYGHPADMDALAEIAAKHDLILIEDAAEAHLGSYKGRPVGNLGDVATFSFYGNKILTCGEGGAVTIRDPKRARHARMLRGQGMDPDRRYYFPITGFNFRMTNVAAAILCAQLDRRDELLTKRAALVAAYREELMDLPNITFQPCAPWATLSPWLFSIVVSEEEELHTRRDMLSTTLASQGIETRPFFLPLHTMPPFCHDARIASDMVITNRLAASGMNLPTSSVMTLDDVYRVSSAVRGSMVGS